ncbi:MAG: ribosome biogenesis/translation initiation ATPase RLI [Candidatus Aenigmarchaeota archaeon ex4484_56]|nr:MAG: ribosome biogenesis/translation initiation ATPase RLI [Candidatus Aenigmarchaeota archaeon ex4484_56]
MRLAIVDEKKCEPKKCENLCERICPRNKLKEKCIIIEKYAKIDENLCIGCGICSNRCPLEAIKIVNTPERHGNLIYRYGENKFALYNLPVPEKGKIIGIIGRNGIGKSTSLKILSKKLKIENLPTMIRLYLQRNIKISYKPQILEKVEINEISKDLIKKLNIKEKEHYSGGELQKLNIAKCLSKDADLYILDEPTSYLDIFERLKIAKIIKEYLSEKEVVIVEHDIAMMDYLADKIYILYGLPGAYGVVSSVYSTLKGINAYLNGYLPTENVKLRKNPIKFERHYQNVSDLETLIKFSNIKKKRGNFKLSINSGEIYRKEIIGVVGPNAIGKTTFAEILSGNIEVDEGNIEKKIKISYKPQYLYADVNSTVKDILPENREFKEHIAYPLHLETLYHKNVKELSGGELQTVAIALCLSKDADLYLLDEPSAFLDIENRLQFVKILQKIISMKDASAMIIDHDIHLIIQLSNRILLFNGVEGRYGEAKIEEPQFALNKFLKSIGITFRKDEETGRYKVNKKESQIDIKQKSMNRYLG